MTRQRPSQQDAYLLARLLGHQKFTNALVPKIGEIYNAIRRPEGNRVLAASNDTGLVYYILTPEFKDYKEGDSIPLAKLDHAVRDIQKRFEWTWQGSAENDVKRAM